MREINAATSVLAAVSHELSNALGCPDDVAAPMLDRAILGVEQAAGLLKSTRNDISEEKTS